MILANHPKLIENLRFPDTPFPRFIMGFEDERTKDFAWLNIKTH